MTELRRGLRARLGRLLAGLGVRKERRGKEISEEATSWDRPCGGQSCPDLAQGQGSTSNVSLKVQAQSLSESDLRVGSHSGFWSHKQRHILGRGTQPLGRLQRPAVGSTCDLANYASIGPESLTPTMSSAEPAGTRCSSPQELFPPCLEQGPPGGTWQNPQSSVPEVPLGPKLSNNLEVSSPLPRPVSFCTAEGTKGKPDTPEPCQTLCPHPSVKRTRYHITVTLQGCGQAPGEEGKEPARPAPHLCGPEESRGWQEPPQGLRPITGCPTNPPREPQLTALSLLRGEAQRQELQAGLELGFPHRRELDLSVTRTSQDRLLGPNMEETAGPPAHAEARVVSATLTWRQRPPAQEETRHRFHKVSLVSGSSQMDAPQEEMFEHSFRREEVNGFVTKEEETVNYQGSGDEAESMRFQSHGPIFSKKYTLPPKEKRPVGRLKEARDWSDGGLQAPRTESPSMGAMTRTELLVPLPGPREPSPHPGMGVTSGNSRNHEEWRVTRTVRTTTLVGGHVDRRVSSSVTVGPTMSGETLPRGRNVSRTVRAMVVNPGAEGSPSRSQALELLSSLVPAECSPPASRLPRPMGPMARSSGLGGKVGKTLAQPFETSTAELQDTSAQTPAGIPAVAYPLRNQGIPAAHPPLDQDGALDARAGDSAQVQETSGPSQSQPAAPSSRPQTHVLSLDLVHSPEGPMVSILPGPQPTPHVLPLVKIEEFSDPAIVPILPMVRSEVTVAPSSIRKKTVPSPGLSVPSPPKNMSVQDSENVSVPTLTQKETHQGPGPESLSDTPKEVVQSTGAAASFHKPTKVVQDMEEVSAIQMEVVQSPCPSCLRKDTVPGPTAPASLTSKQDESVRDSEESPISPPAPKENIQSSAVPLAPSVSEIKVSPSPQDTPAPVPIQAEANTQPQLVPDLTKGKMSLEPSREEDEASLTADLEIFLDTLRSMEPPEILHTHRLPRAPRSSYLAMYATLPAIEEDQPGPWVPGPSPQEVPSLEEEEEEELENPYLSDDEKLQRRQEKAGPSPSWDPIPAKPTQVTCSPLEMMKKHVAGTKGFYSEQGPESQPSNRPTSRLGGSLLFGSLVPTTKDVPTLEPLGTKLSALPPHGPPGLRKVLGQLPLLCSGRPQPEKLARTKLPEGWSPTLKTQGKLNTRPGKVILFSEPGCQGSSREVWRDVPDALSWAPIASIRVVRCCWVLYEQPEFQGRKLFLPEGDVDFRALTSAWSNQGIGSLRRVVRDYCTPEINLFSEEGLKGEQRKLTEALKDVQGLERPLKVASATVSAGLWLLYPKPSFEDTPYILELGKYPTSEAWGTSDSSVGSLKPMRLGCPSVEKPGEPKALVYEAPDFQGRSWEVSRDIYNLQQPEDSQSPQLASVGSLRILGGCWVGYEKEGFRGHQYLLEEGEYTDWSQWGGYDELLTSLRVIRTDFGDPAVVLFEAMDFEGHGVEVSSALPDVELLQHGPSTQAIHVLSGVWVAYEQVGFSGEQYVLEKGVYRNCDDWGAGNSSLGSLQPVLQVGEHDLHFVSKIQLFSGPDFLGDHISFEDDQASLPASFLPQSCRVHGGSWILFDEKNFKGDQHILSEGEFPTLTAMGCLASTVLGSLRKVPLYFSEPAIFLYGLECFEGKEIELSREVRSLQAEGFNNHVLSVRIKGGVWVLCEHSDFRGRQWLVGSCEITNWLTYSSTQRVGSLYPIKQRRAYFRLWNAALGGFLAVPDHVEDMKAGRVVVSEPRAGGSCIWYYEEGLLKNQVAPTMSLQVIGPPSLGSKVVLWAESRLPRQTWSISELGHICSQMFEGRILDVKGGRGYDRDHVVMWEPATNRPSQIWTIHVL